MSLLMSLARHNGFLKYILLFPTGSSLQAFPSYNLWKYRLLLICNYKYCQSIVKNIQTHTIPLVPCVTYSNTPYAPKFTYAEYHNFIAANGRLCCARHEKRRC